MNINEVRMYSQTLSVAIGTCSYVNRSQVAVGDGQGMTAEPRFPHTALDSLDDYHASI